jgi:hypothetical protein
LAHVAAGGPFLDVHACQQEGVEQRTVLAALKVVDAVALAVRIDAVGAGRMAPPRQVLSHQAANARSPATDARDGGVTIANAKHPFFAAKR